MEDDSPTSLQPLFRDYKPKETSKKRCLIIGIDYNGNETLKLNGCVNDACSMKELVTRHGYADNDYCMRVMTDTPETPDHLQPTKANIIRSLEWLVEGAASGDSLFLHYSGHGLQIDDENGDEEDEMDEAIVPVDYDFNDDNLIVDDQLFAILFPSLPSGCRFTAVFDCCHSGSILDLPFVYDVEGKLTENRESNWLKSKKKSAENEFEHKPHIILLSGCEDARVTKETRFNSKSHGAFTATILRHLRSPKQVTWYEVMKELRRKSRDFFQVPQLSSLERLSLNSAFEI